MNELNLQYAVADSSVSAAVQWIEMLLFGRVGMAIAILAVSLAAFRVLWGYSSPIEMARILFGCFILFGAPKIAHAFIGMSVSRYASISSEMPVPTVSAAPAPLLKPHLPPVTINPFDPYAGSTLNR